MQTLRLRAAPPTGTIIRCHNPRVYIDGLRRRDLIVLAWELLAAPEFGRVKLVGLTSEPGLPRIEDAVLPPIGAAVRIDAPQDGEDFHGFVARHLVEVNADGEHLLAEADHWLAVDLGERLIGRWEFGEGQTQEYWVKEETVSFNAGEGTLASESTRAIRNRPARVFDSSLTAQPWTVADALGYLIAASVGHDIQTPSLQELDNLAGDIELGSLNVTGQTVRDALMNVARRGGLVLRSSRQGRALVFYRPGRQGRRRSIRLQKAGSALSLDDSNLWKGRIRFHRRPSHRGLLARGKHKRYEATFLLAPGWDPDKQTSRWRDFIRSEPDNWPDTAKVYRKWVLNEHGRYDQDPWSIPTYDFSEISAEDFYLCKPRKFLPRLSTDVADPSMGVVVQIKCGSDVDWRRWSGPLWVSANECSVYLGGDSLPADYFEAVIADEAQVRVTATVLADARISIELPGDTGYPREVADFSGRVEWRKVHPTSIFFQGQTSGASGERDDSALLKALATRASEMLSAALEAELTLGWIDTSFGVGDILERIDGRSLELSPNPDSRAFVQSVSHDFGAGQCTRLIVSG